MTSTILPPIHLPSGADVKAAYAGTNKEGKEQVMTYCGGDAGDGALAWKKDMTSLKVNGPPSRESSLSDITSPKSPMTPKAPRARSVVDKH